MAGKRTIVVGRPPQFPTGELFAGDLAAYCARQGKHQFIAPRFRGRIDRPVIVGRDDTAEFAFRIFYHAATPHFRKKTGYEASKNSRSEHHKSRVRAFAYVIAVIGGTGVSLKRPRFAFNSEKLRIFTA
ncbi:hypothetical protein BGC31_11225 [Komagataeibacter xylinus]|nr:hypothetical protein BFX83_11045 [Komagataeibacter xylinus]RFP02433.1 hypothetical protein BGC31_11225 [Komagataeibacter xylinus]